MRTLAGTGIVSSSFMCLESNTRTHIRTLTHNYSHICTHIHIYSHTQTHAHIHTHTHNHSHTTTQTHTKTHTQSHAPTRTLADTRMVSLSRTNTHTHTHTRTYTHTQAHIFTHTDTHAFAHKHTHKHTHRCGLWRTLEWSAHHSWPSDRPAHWPSAPVSSALHRGPRVYPCVCMCLCACAFISAAPCPRGNYITLTSRRAEGQAKGVRKENNQGEWRRGVGKGLRQEEIRGKNKTGRHY
jgi:hypothetical protein